MSDDDYFRPTLLNRIPPTDPEIMKRMEAARVQGKHYAAIGKIASAWAHLEFEIDLAAMVIAEVKTAGIGICFTAQIIGATRKFNTFTSIAELIGVSPRLIKDFAAFSEKINGLNELRNRSVHDIWFFNHPNPPTRLEATVRKKLKLNHIETSTDDLLHIVQNIEKLQVEFKALSDRVLAEKQAMSETSQPSTDS